MKKRYSFLGLLGVSLILSACSSTPPKAYDYSAFQESKPRSILVLMPTDSTNEVKAGSAVLAQSVRPLAEAGYYVFPVALVNETFKQNGLSQAQEIHNVSLSKLNSIFGADSILYLDVDEYGTNYQIFESVTKVSVKGKLVDSRNGKTLWSGSAQASSNENSGNDNSGILVKLISAAITQISNTISDKSYSIAAIADARLLNTGTDGALLYGPYHVDYGKDPQLIKKD